METLYMHHKMSSIGAELELMKSFSWCGADRKWVNHVTDPKL